MSNSSSGKDKRESIEASDDEGGYQSNQEFLGESYEDEEDEEVRLAKEMAMAISKNPSMTADQIRELTSAKKKKSTMLKKAAKSVKSGGKEIKAMAKSGGKEIKAMAKSGGKEIKALFKSSKPKSADKAYSDKSPGGSGRSTPRSQSPSASASRGDFNLEPVKGGSGHGSAKSPRISGKKISTSISSAASTPTSAPRLSAAAPPMTPRLGDYLDSAGVGGVPGINPSGSGGSKDAGDESYSGYGNSNSFQMGGPPIRITGIVWKRRSGLGKYSVTAAWERRRIVLKGNKLFYYRTEVDSKDDESLGSGDSSLDDRPVLGWLETTLKTATYHANAIASQAASVGLTAQPKGGGDSARGMLNLVKENASVCATYGHSGSPTPFALSIKVLTQTKWKLCFDTHGELMQWLAAMTDVIVQGSVDNYNAQILQANDPRYAGEYSVGQLSEPPLIAAQSEAKIAGGHRLWVTGHYQVHSEHFPQDLDDISEDELEDVQSDDDLTVNEGRRKQKELTRSHSMETYFELDPSSGKDVWSFPVEYIWHFALLWNFAIIVARASSTSVENFWYLLTFANMALFGCLTKSKIGGTVKPHLPLMTPKMARRLSMNSSFPVMGGDSVSQPSRKVSMSMISVEEDSFPPAASAGDFLPLAGSTTMRIEKPTDLPVNKEGLVFAGWRRADPASMQIRSHGYKTTKAKVDSPGELYQCVHADIFEGKTRYPDMASRVKIPKVMFKDDGPKTWNAPDIFVVSIAIPTDPPKLYGSTENGGGYTVTIYFAMRQETRDILRRVTADGYNPKSEKYDDIQKSKVNAVRLFDEWCRRAPTDDTFMARFKVLPNAQNLKEIGLPTWISKYNGKPFLIKRPGETGFLYRHPDKSCMEFDISLYPFPYLAKQGICFMKDQYFKKVLVTFGFLIEGRSDDELPECLIGLMQLCYPDPTHAVQADDFFSGRSPKSFQEQKPIKPS